MAKGISLHIGLNEVDANHYSGWSGPLNACESDAEDVESLAKKQGFETEVLLTSQATRDSVIRSTKNAAEALKKGDIFLISYSGHGGQVQDVNGDEEDDIDETWCLYDGQLLDDELFLLWSEFIPEVRILVLSDSCHSGTVTRAPGGAHRTAPTEGALAEELGTVGASIRCMPTSAAHQVYRRNKAFYDQLQHNLPKEKPELSVAVRLISGCQDNQVSLDGTFNGLFTGRLLKVWNSGRFQGDYNSFHSKIVRRMPGEQSPNHFVIGVSDLTYDRQKPFTI